jgi:hypothetical protein
MSCWPPSPCDRLSRSPRRARHRPRLLRGLRPTRHGPRPRTRVFSPHPDWLSGRDERPRRMVPTFTRSSIGQGGAQLYSGSIATATPQAFTMASPPLELNGFGVDPPPGCRALHTGPYPPGWSRLRGYGASDTGSLALHLLTSLDEPAPSGSTSTARLLGAACHQSPSFPAIGCPDASSDRCDGPTETVSHHLSIHLAPRGAQLGPEESRRCLQNSVGPA